MKLGFALPVVLAAALTAGMASAATVNLKFDGGTSSGTAKIDAAPVMPVSGLTTYGAYGFNMTDTSGSLGSFVAWCLDIMHPLATSGVHEYITTNTPFSNSYGLDLGQMSRVQNLFDAVYATLIPGNQTQAASFQAALWESLYDTDRDVSTGEFRVSGPDTSLANSYLVLANDFTGSKAYNLTFLESTGRDQNLVTAAVVPLPAGGILLLSALGGIGMLRRKRNAA